jgi:hypothetical protein
VQLRMGFEVRGMLPGYIEDTASDNWATLIVWPNPTYVEGKWIVPQSSTSES